jgi:imidazolonepropionase-like amidohydrolase
MKTLRTLVRAAALAGVVTAVTWGATAPATPVAFVDVTVLPMDSDRVLTRQTVLVTGDRITAVGPHDAIPIPAAARRINGEGKFLLPGLGEMHGHNPSPSSSRQAVENIYFLFVANGVTTVRSMLGWAGQLELRDQVNAGEILGPTLYLAGPSFSGTTVQSPGQARQRVRDQKAEGWDLLKVHPGIRRDVYDAMARTADDLKIRFAGHVPADVGLVHAIGKRQETIDHLDGYIEHLKAETGPVDRERLAEIVKLTRDTNTAVVPTMVLWETIIGAGSLSQMSAFPELVYMPAAMVRSWQQGYSNTVGNPNFDRARATRIAANRKVVLKALSDGGVTILFGTDAPQVFSVPGFSVHREMKAMAEAGMSNYEILRSATRNVGEYFKARDKFGTVAAGQRADLLLLDANPLTDVAHVARRAGVMVRGRWLPDAEIQAGLAKVAASEW